MNTSFTNLVGCSAPIQLAGMGPVCSDELCAAVSQAGGLGMITVAGTSPDGLAARLDRIASLTSRPVGANFVIPAVDRDCLRIASRSVRVVDFFWGDPDPELVKIAHSGGALVSWQVGSAAEALSAERSGCDFIIAPIKPVTHEVRACDGPAPLAADLGTCPWRGHPGGEQTRESLRRGRPCVQMRLTGSRTEERACR